MTMTKEELLVLFQEKIGDYLPEYIRNSCTVETVQVMKSNDTLLNGICFNRGEDIPGQTFYIERIYENYLNGESPEMLMEELARAVEGSWDFEVPLDFTVAKYEDVKDKLTFQLVDAQCNREMLKECVHEKMGNDLAMICYVAVQKDNGYMRALVSNNMMELLGVDSDQIIKDAKASMEKQFPAILNCPQDLLKDIMESGRPVNLLEQPDIKLENKLYALSNEGFFMGASSIMYEGIQEKLGNMFEGNYYVIPSSNMEVMLIPAKGAHDVSKLLEMLREGNETLVEPDEFLSNRLFMYDRGEKMLAEVTTPNRGRNLEWER